MQPLSNSVVSKHIERAIANKKSTIQKMVLAYSRAGKRRHFPWREPGRTPYEILIAEVALKRTTATAANSVYCDILDKFPSLDALIQAPLEKIADTFSPIGLQCQRSRSLKALAVHVTENHNGKVPHDLEALLSVPGIGHYTARAVLSFAFETPVAIVDSNVTRVLRRLFAESLPQSTDRRTIQDLANQLLPPANHKAFNWGLLDLGALVCRPLHPHHEECPLYKVCDRASIVQRQGISPPSRPPGLPTRLHGLRKRRGLSLVALAERAGVSKKTLINAEKGRTTPTASTVKKLATALQVDPAYLSEQQ